MSQETPEHSPEAPDPNAPGAGAGDGPPAPAGPAPSLLEGQTDDRTPIPWGAIIVWLTLVLAGYLCFASATTLWDRDEPRFARAAVEMLRSGDYLVPTFNARLRPDKPAGIYWLMTVTVRLLGPTELAVRFWSGVGIVLASLATLLAGRRLFSTRVGMRAMIILPTCAMPLFLGTAATADGMLLGCVTLSMWAMIELLHGRRIWAWALLLAVTMGCSQLIKGPVGLAPPLLAAFTAGLLGWRHQIPMTPRPTRIAIILAAAGSLLIFLAWAVPANTASGNQLLKLGLGEHVVDRMKTAREGHGGESVLEYLVLLPVYVPVVIAGFFPWTIALPAGLSALCRRTLAGPRERILLWSWIAPTFILMTFIVTRLPHYVMPIFPGLAILTAAAIDAWRAGQLGPRDIAWFKLGGWLVFLTACVMAGALLIAPWVLGDIALGVLAAPVAGAVLAGGFWLGHHHIRERFEKTLPFVPIYFVLIVAAAAVLLMPPLERSIKPSPELARAMRQAGADDPQVEIQMRGYQEPSLVFYLDRPAGVRTHEMAGGGERLREWASRRTSSHALLVATDEDLRRADALQDHLGLTVLLDRKTLNYSKAGREQHIFVLRRPAADEEAP